MCYRKLTSRFWARLPSVVKDNRGVALFIVLSAMATLAIFVGEITYTSQVNQKLAYDRLDQIKAHALAKSGLRLGLLRIRAYNEIKKTVGDMAKKMGGTAADASAVIPKAIMEKIWNEPITIPFSGDISGLPMSARDALGKFRKDSGMEGKLYISIQAQSSRFNLNSTIAAFAPTPAPPTTAGGATPTATPPGAGGSGGGVAANPSGTPQGYDQAEARKLLAEQIKDTFAKKFEDDEKFRDRYRSLRPEDLADEILGWSDLSYESQAAQRARFPFKQAPFYDVSELHFLPSVDDEIYNLLESQYTTGVASGINVNSIREPVLMGLVPGMTAEERKKFFEFRDNTGPSEDSKSSGAAADAKTDEDNTFKTADDFFKYLKEKVASFGGSQTRVDDLKTALTQRGITIVTEESNFLVHIEATINQTKRTLEASVVLVDDPAANKPKTGGPAGAAPTATPNPNTATTPVNSSTTGRSNLKITQLRFL